jgi:hypothetical protein
MDLAIVWRLGKLRIPRQGNYYSELMAIKNRAEFGKANRGRLRTKWENAGHETEGFVTAREAMLPQPV